MESYSTLANAPYLWLALGAALLAMEAFGVSGIGFLFAGLGAIVAALAAYLGWAENIWSQFAWSFAATVIWAAVLWMPMKKLKAQAHSGVERFDNMVGGEATVSESGLQPGKLGKVSWSGTVMNARLATGEAAVEAGGIVIIRQVKGTTLIVGTEKQGEV